MEARVHLGVHARDHVGDVEESVVDAAHDLFFALGAVSDEGADMLGGVCDWGSVGGPVDGVVALEEALEGGDVGGHVAVGRSDDAGGPFHDMVAGEEGVFLREGEAHVV